MGRLTGWLRRGRGLCAGAGMLLLIMAGPAQAVVGLNKSFSPISTATNQPARLTITLLNPNNAAATDAALTDHLHAGLVIANPPNASTSCTGGTVTASAGGAEFSLSGATVPASPGDGPGQCNVSVDVLASDGGTYTNELPAGALSSSQGGNLQATSASLTVVALSPITGSKSFASSIVHGNDSRTMTITLRNNNTTALTGVAFTDPLPSRLRVAAAPNATSSCGGTLAATAGGTSVQLSGGTVAANGACTISVNVSPADPNGYFNSSVTNTIPLGAVTAAQGPAASNTAALSASMTMQTGARIVKSFAASPIAHGDNSRLTLTIENYNVGAAMPINFTDTLPAGVTALGVASNTCGGTASALGDTVTLSGGSVGAAPATASGATTCALVIDYTASNTAAAPVTRTNGLAQISGINFGGVQPVVVAASVVIYPPGAISVAKSFSGTPVQTGTINLNITLRNATATDAAIHGFTDNLGQPTMGTGISVVNAGGVGPTTTCGGTVNAADGGTMVTKNDGSIPAGSSCTITVPLRIAGNASLTTRTNTIGSGGLITSAGNFTGSVSASFTVARALTVAKSFSPTAIVSGLQNATMTITLTRAAGATALTNLAFNDVLPDTPYQMVIAGPPAAAASTTCGGSLTAVPGSRLVSLSGGSRPVGTNGAATSCTVTVPVTAAAGSGGTATNTLPIGAVTSSNENVRNESTVSANLTANDASISVAKGFTPSIVNLGGTSRLTLQLLNNNLGSVALTGVRFTDTLPAGMVVAPVPNASFVSPSGTGCSAGTGVLSAAAGSKAVGLVGAGASISANSVCVLSVDVVATAAGNLINTIAEGAITSNQGPTNLDAVTATLSATGIADVIVTKSHTPEPVTAGGAAIYTIEVRNDGPNDVAGVRFSDTPPAGMTFQSWTCNAVGGAVCPSASGSGPIDGFITIPASLNGASKVIFTVTAGIDSGVTGSIVNTARVNVPGAVVVPDPAHNSATDTAAVSVRTGLTLLKTDGSPTYTPGGTGTYVITVGNTGQSNATNVSLADELPDGVTLTAGVSCMPTASASCGTVTGNAGTRTLNVTGASIPAGAANTLTYTLPVRFAPGLTVDPLVNTVTAQAGADAVTAQDSNALLAAADLVVTKEATQPADGSYLPGKPLDYAITVRNDGPSDLTGVRVTDAIPSSVKVGNWSCSGTGGAMCDGLNANASGSSNNISLGNVSLPANQSISITISGVVELAATGDIVNHVTAAPPLGTTCAAAPCTRSASVTSTNAGVPKLAIDKTATPTAFAVGHSGFYSLQVSNTGTSSTAGTYTVTDALPAGITATSTPTGADWNCGDSTGTAISCTSTAVLTPGALAAVIRVPVAIAAGAASPAVNTARVSGGGDSTCPDTGTSEPHCQVTLQTPVTAPSFTVSKSLQNPKLVAGQANAYVITVVNNGLSDTLAGQIDDTFPATIEIGTLPDGCSRGAGQAVSCLIPAGIPHGGQISYVLPVTPLASAVGQVAHNTATVSGGGDPGCPTAANCSASDNSTITAPQLHLAKNIEPTTLVVGQAASYTLTVSNNGTAATAGAVTVTDTFPAGLALGALPDGCSASELTVTCTASSLAVDASASFVIPVTPQFSLNGLSIANTARVAGGGDPGCVAGTAQENLPARCQASVLAPVNAPQLTLSKTASGDFAVGVPVTYRLHVQNTGSADTRGTIRVVDVVPAGLSIGSMSDACSRVDQQVSCAVADPLAPGAGVSFAITVTPTASAFPTVSNTATALGGGDLVCPNADNCKSTLVSSVSAPQLQVTQSANGPWTIGQGGAGLTLQVSNVGQAATVGEVTVLLTLPAGLEPGWTGTQVFDGWTCTAAGQSVSCHATPDLAAGAGAAMVLPVNPVAPLPDGSASLASVAGGSDPFNAGQPPSPGAACATLDAAVPGHCSRLDITVPASAHVSVSKTLAPGIRLPAVPGQVLSYLLTATNSGDTAVNGYTVNEIVPAGTRFTSVADGTSSCEVGAPGGSLVFHQLPQRTGRRQRDRDRDLHGHGGHSRWAHAHRQRHHGAHQLPGLKLRRAAHAGQLHRRCLHPTHHLQYGRSAVRDQPGAAASRRGDTHPDDLARRAGAADAVARGCGVAVARGSA